MLTQYTWLWYKKWHNEPTKVACADIYKADQTPNSWLGSQWESQQCLFVLLCEFKCLIM